MRRFDSAALLLYLTLAAFPAQAGAVRLDTPSGYPVPRFLSLKGETNCRIGPSRDHPVRFLFQRAGAPVMVVAESVDHWRRVRDATGEECWVHEATLKAQTHVLSSSETNLRWRPNDDAKVKARLGAGVLARLLRRKGDWILIAAGNERGWTPAAGVWGGAVVEAASVRQN